MVNMESLRQTRKMWKQVGRKLCKTRARHVPLAFQYGHRWGSEGSENGELWKLGTRFSERGRNADYLACCILMTGRERVRVMNECFDVGRGGKIGV